MTMSHTLLLQLQCTFLLLALIIHPASSQTTPSPTPAGSGGFEVGGFDGDEVSNPFLQTLSPTMQVILPGRGNDPTISPTYKPTGNPTETDMGSNVDILIPGIDMDAEPTDGTEGKDDTPPPVPVPVTTAAPVAVPVVTTSPAKESSLPTTYAPSVDDVEQLPEKAELPTKNGGSMMYDKRGSWYTSLFFGTIMAIVAGGMVLC